MPGARQPLNVTGKLRAARRTRAWPRVLLGVLHLSVPWLAIAAAQGLASIRGEVSSQSTGPRGSTAWVQRPGASRLPPRPCRPVLPARNVWPGERQLAARNHADALVARRSSVPDIVQSYQPSQPSRSAAGLLFLPRLAQPRSARRSPQAVDPDVIEQVLDACSGNVERATEALISMAEQARDPHATADDDLVFGAPDGGPGEPPAASSAPAVELTWHALPGDVKLEVFARLTVREACRAAATCRDFAHLAAALRAQVTSLVIPASSVEGLRRGRQGPLRDALVAHPSARTVSFQR